MKSLIFILFIFSFISQAAEVEVDWYCPQENYPGVPQLEEQKKVKVVLEDSAVKFKPDPFKPAILGDSFFRSINPLNKTKKSLAVDYSSCINDFVNRIKEKVPDYKEEWARKIKNDIESKSFFAKSKDNKLLPTQWEYNKRYNLKYDQWQKAIVNICTNGSIEFIGPDLLRMIESNAKVTNAHPSKKCMDEIVKTVQDKIAKDESEFCEYSEKICKGLKDMKANVSAVLESAKTKRATAMKADEEKFEKILAQDNEAGFEDGFNSMFSKSPSDCAQYTTNIPGPNGTYGEQIKMHNLLSKNLDRFMDHMDGNCQQVFMRKYMERNNSQSLVGDWGIIAYCKINETPFCTGLQDRFKIVNQNIERMLEKAYGQAGKEFYNNVACEIEPGPQSLDELLGQLKQFDKALACRDLKVGESQVVDSYNGVNSPTGISMRYSLEKTDDNKFKARFNLNFKPNSGATVSGQQMFDRAKTCMKDLSPYFKGPNGEVMEVDIVNSEEASKLKSNQRPPKIDIAISGPDHRSNSGDYNQNIDCGTIAHEVMHLMGLCDEYKEMWTGNYYDPETGKVVAKGTEGSKFLPDYNCRVVASVPSIMSHQNEVIDKVVPKAPICRCETADCRKLTKSSKKVQELYIKDPWGIANARINSKYCSYKLQAASSLASFEENGELLTLNEESDKAVGYTIRYWETENPKQVQNLKINCACPSDDESCPNYISDIRKAIADNNIPQKTYCPAGSDNVFTKPGRVAEGITHDEAKGTFTFNGGYNNQDGSLLHPEHFARVIGGLCPEKGKSYSDCAKFAYKTDASGKCEGVPKECLDPKFFLGTKQ